MARLLLLIIFTLPFGKLIDIPLQQIPKPTPIPSDNSILSQIVCEFPCWDGIIPGESKIDEVYNKLVSIPFYTSSPNKSEKRYKETSLPDSKTQTLISWWYDDPNKKNFIVLENDTVTSISIFPNANFTLEEVVQLFGEPSGTQIVYNAGSETPYIRINLILYYPKNGLLVEFLLYSKDGIDFISKVDVSPEIQGIKFSLYPSEKTLDILVEKTLSGGYPYPVLPNWIGIGSVLISPTETFPFGLPNVVTATPQP